MKKNNLAKKVYLLVPKQLWLQMKITTLLLIITAFCIQANNSYSQNVKVSLNIQNATITDIFHEIENRTDYRFFYNKTLLDTEKRVSVNSNEKEVSTILDQLLAGENVSYTMVNNYIVIIPKEKEEVYSSEVAQNNRKTLIGTVTDEYGEPIIGANIIEKGTTNGTVTDIDGKFNITVSDGAVLLFSYIGYKNVEIPVEDQTIINVQLQEDSEILDEVVVVGYGVQKKVNVTGAVDVISDEKLKNRQSPNVSQLLQGTAPGLNLSIGNNYGFQPGATMDVTIRGMGSLNGGSPLILIDGSPGDMNLLNPEDIETISILKDASSSAIYGARAPYGVILITTKKGNRKEKISINFSSNLMIESPMPLPTMLDSWKHARVLNEAGRNGGGSPIGNETIDRMIAFQNEDWDYLRESMPNWPEGATNFGAYPEGNVWNNANLNYANTNWWDIYFGSAINHKHNLSISGGAERSSYYLSLGYLNQNSVIQYGTDYYNRFNLMGKFEFDITDWWSVSYEPRYSNSVRERPNMTQAEAGDYDHMFRHLLRSYPWTPMYNGWGSPEEGGGYIMESHIPSILSGTDKSDIRDYWNTLKTEISFKEGLKLNADFTYNDYSQVYTRVHKTVYLQNVDKTYYPFGNTTPNQYEQTHYRNNFWTSNIYATYNLNINQRHDLLFLVGAQFEKGNNITLNGFKTDMIFQDVPSLQTATGEAIVNQYLSNNATQGYFSRLGYNFSNRYLLEANFRYDGSYVFTRGNRWGFFPSLSIGWNIHNEAFWAVPQEYVSTLKIRGSWGQLGNQNISPYSDLALMPINTGKLDWIFQPGGTRQIGFTSAPGIINRNLTWETSTTKNMGLNAGLFNNKLQVDFDLFERLTTDMVGPSAPKPGVLGANVPQSNNATLRTRGWELNINWRQNIGKDLSYFVNANLSDYKSVVTQYYNPNNTLSTWYEGRVVGEIWGYTVNDLFRSQDEVDLYLSKIDPSFIATNWRPGDIRYEDINGDGMIDNGKNTLEDHGDLSIIGNSEPRLQFGVNLGASYKNFDFSMLWKGVGKRDYYFNQNAVFYWGIMRAWWDTNIDGKGKHLDYFRDEPGTKYYGLYEGDANINTEAFFPRPYLDSTNDIKNRGHANTRYLANAAYLRLQNIQLGYTLPQKVISRLHLRDVRLFFSGENLLTIDNLPKLIDPAAIVGFNNLAGAATYGADRIYSFGFSITY
ncbi:TonB-linked outer membrane protein, SusC/RagA family [Porphyromonadaceae bacterium NLAE-zl-C104]|nr:TonB-linked outer membrane protein, SusC/RagA family [Porphyromonadaceae bacterium NLAE-zl-C104]